MSRWAEPVNDPVIHGHLDDPATFAVAANDAGVLHHSAKCELGGAAEIDDRYVDHC
jgi:hypothetical protein